MTPSEGRCWRIASAWWPKARICWTSVANPAALAAPPVPLEVELARVLPIVREAVRLGVPVSVDTYKPGVMQAVLDLGADIINDIWALRQSGAREVVAAIRPAACA
jgi:dihydropteroate synthase